MSTTKPVDHNVPLVLHRNQSVDLPLPGAAAMPGSLTWGAESADPEIVTVRLSADRGESAHSNLVVWQLHLTARRPGKTTVRVHETAATHPITTRYSFVLELTVLESEEVGAGIMLLPNVDNLLRVHGELAWYSVQDNASTGYRWVCVPDTSGVYELAEKLTLQASTVKPVIGAPGSMTIRKWRGVRPGHGVITFHHVPPGSERPAEIVTIRIQVQ